MKEDISDVFAFLLMVGERAGRGAASARRGDVYQAWLLARDAEFYAGRAAQVAERLWKEEENRG